MKLDPYCTLFRFQLLGKMGIIFSLVSIQCHVTIHNKKIVRQDLSFGEDYISVFRPGRKINKADLSGSPVQLKLWPINN